MQGYPAGSRHPASRATYQHVSGLSSVSCYYLAGQCAAVALTTAAVSGAGGDIKAVPFIAPLRGGVIDQLAFRVTTAEAAVNARIGIYTNISESNVYPASLLFDSGEISLASTGVKTATVPASAGTLTGGGLYWLALITNATTAVFRALAAGSAAPLYGIDTAMGTAALTHIGDVITYGALPATFPAVNVASGGPWALAYRLAA